jgi:hypothetical protein
MTGHRDESGACGDVQRRGSYSVTSLPLHAHALISKSIGPWMYNTIATWTWMDLDTTELSVDWGWNGPTLKWTLGGRACFGSGL